MKSSSNGQHFDLSHLAIEEATARYDLDPWCGPGAFLSVRPATKQNRGYWSALLAMAAGRKRIADAVAGRLEDDAQDRADDAVLFSAHVVVGGLAREAGGSMVELTSASAGQLVLALADKAPWLFDRMRAFCMRPDNFAKLPPEVTADVGALAKN